MPSAWPAGAQGPPTPPHPTPPLPTHHPSTHTTITTTTTTTLLHPTSPPGELTRLRYTGSGTVGYGAIPPSPSAGMGLAVRAPAPAPAPCPAFARPYLFRSAPV